MSNYSMSSLGYKNHSVALLKIVLAVGGTPLFIGTLSRVLAGKFSVDLVGKSLTHGKFSVVGVCVMRTFLQQNHKLFLLPQTRKQQKFVSSECFFSLKLN